jgi:AraC family transcriptional regulator
MLLVGLSGDFTSPKGIPELWQKFESDLGKIPGQRGHIAYGIVMNDGSSPAKFSYMAAVRVNTFSGVPAHLSRLTIPAYKYKVFLHDEHVSKISSTVEKLRNSSTIAAGVPSEGKFLAFLEHYGEEFDPKTGMGGMEIWVPSKD